MHFVERADVFLNDYQKENDFYGSVRVTHKGKIVYEKIREHLKILKSYPMNFRPGTDTMYANINMILM